MQFFAVDDHQLGVVADQLVIGAADHDALVEHAQLELAQPLLAAGVGVRDERADRDAAFDRGFDGLLDRLQVEAENDEVERFLRALDGVERRLDAVSRLNNQIHVFPPPSQAQPCARHAF